MKKHVIAMVAACPFPANYGSPASIREMSDTLCESGNEVHIITYPHGDETLPVKYARVHRVAGESDAKRIKVGPSGGKIALDLRMVSLVCRVIREHHVDVIHAHNYEGALIGTLAHWITGKPLLYNAVNTMGDELSSYNFIRPAFLANMLAGVLDWFVPRTANHISTVTEELRQWMLKEGIRPERVTYVPAGILPEMFTGGNGDQMRERHQLGKVPIVLYTGTLGKFQRIDYLLQAFQEVLKAIPEAKLVIVHPIVESREGHQALAKSLGISENVIWIGPHPLEELPAYLAMADVAVVPRPDCPGHPVKLINYMMAACPIACFEGSAKNVSHGHSAWTAPDHDTKGLGEAIIKLIQDPELGRKLGAAAKKVAEEKLDWRSICKDIEKIYRALSPKQEIPVDLATSELKVKTDIEIENTA